MPQFGLLDELTELKKASEAEEELNLQRDIIAEEPVKLSQRFSSGKHGSVFLRKRGQGLALAEDITGGEVAASDLEGMISEATSANTIGEEAAKVALDAAIAAKAKEANAVIKEAAFAFDAASSNLDPPEVNDVRQKLRAAVQSAE